MPEVIIRRDKDGMEFGIQSGDFRRGKHYRDPKTGEMVTYEAAGFHIVSHMDGSPYEAPAERHPAPASGEHSAP